MVVVGGECSNSDGRRTDCGGRRAKLRPRSGVNPLPCKRECTRERYCEGKVLSLQLSANAHRSANRAPKHHQLDEQHFYSADPIECCG